MRAATLLLLPLLARVAGQEAETYVGAVTTPRMLAALEAFVTDPADAVVYTLAAEELGLLEPTEQLRSWLYSQTLARASSSSFTMFYAGLEDGTFIGYFDPQSFTFRPPGAAAASDPVSSEVCTARNRSDAAAVAACGAVVLDGSPATCTGGGSCAHSPLGTLWDRYAPSTLAGMALRRGNAAGAESLAATCPAAGERVGGVLGRSCTVSCCDRDIRTYYTTSRADRGVPTALTKWLAYDPRERPWYTQEMARSAAASQSAADASATGWSSVYAFSTTGELGITATGAMLSNGRLRGVVAIDYTLEAISGLLNTTRSGQSSWSYIVERQGSSAGKLIGSTADLLLYNKTAGLRLNASSSASASIARSAALLEADGWPTTFLSAAEGDGVSIEAVSTRFTRGGQLDWLLVAGQSISCPSFSIWSFGKCLRCPSGERPDAERRACVSCPPGMAGSDGVCSRCPDGTGPNEARSNCVTCGEGSAGRGGVCAACNITQGLVPDPQHHSCVCPVGTFGSAESAAGLRCTPCDELEDKIEAGFYAELPAFQDEAVCPGGDAANATICPMEGLWIDHATTGVRLVPCDACLDAPDDTMASQCSAQFNPAVCKPTHTGFLCADCIDGHTSIAGDCVPCEKPNLGLIVTEIGSAVAIGLFLMYDSLYN